MIPTRRTRQLAWLAAALLGTLAALPPNLADAAATYVGQRWVYDWAWQGYYVLYRSDLQRGGVYVIEVVPETMADDPDLYVGTSRPRGTNNARCSPWNYLWKSTRHGGYTERVSFTAGYTGYHYFCVYAYAPKWTGWYVRARHL